MAISVTDTARTGDLGGPVPHRFTVDDYYKMGEVGILAPDSRVELIRGEIFDMPPIGPGHAGSGDRLGDLLREILGPRVLIRRQNPVRLEHGSEPEPDIAVVHRRDDYYTTAHPVPAEVLLVVEVSVSTLPFDRTTKGPLYAEAGIPEYWIVNLVESVIEVYREPKDGVYRSVTVLKRGDTIQPLAFPDVTISLDDLLG